MKNVLIVQLCRLGDILQTTPMLRGLRREHPEARITLLVLDGFAEAPVPATLYDRLVAFPFDRISETLQDPRGWKSGLALVREAVNELAAESYDLVLNLTGSPLANLICALVPSKEVRGGVIAPDRSRTVRGPWMTYFWASLLSRSTGCINLVDLFQWVAGVGIDGEGLEVHVPADAHQAMDAWLRSHDLAGSPLIALQLGASDERKRWQPERFAAMAALLPEDYTILFVGSASERPLIDRARAVLARRSVSAAGETSIRELAALLSRCALLVTNDTGTMHVASAVGTRIVDLSTGPVFVHETGPYGTGHLAVEPAIGCFPCAAGSVCHHLACRDDFDPADIAGVARFALGVGDCPRPPGARILQARRASTGRLEFLPIWEPAPDVSGGLRPLLARMWESTLPVPSPCLAISTSARLESAPERIDPSGLQALRDLADRAVREATRIAQLAIAVQAERAGKLESMLGQAITLAAVHATVAPIVAFLRTEIESCASRDVLAVLKAYRAAWHAAGQRARWLLSNTEVQRDMKASIGKRSATVSRAAAPSTRAFSASSSSSSSESASS